MDFFQEKIKSEFNSLDYSLKGIVLILSAELLFAIASVFAKIITNTSEIAAIEITFFRFAIGIVISGYYLNKTGQSFRPSKPLFVLLRAILNTAAFILFFYSVEYTTITNANMLNMTYPIFIFLISIVFFKRIPSLLSILLLIASTYGIYLVIKPDFDHINYGDILGLLSGLVGAAAIISLRYARKFDSSLLILFYLMSIGFVINLLIMIPVFKMPQGIQWLYLLLSGLAGFLGQWLLTDGYKYISARYGSMMSSSRVVYASILGLLIFNESLSIRVIIGALLIIISIIGISNIVKDN